MRRPAAASRVGGEKEALEMLWLLLLILLVIAVGGGIVLSKFLFLVLVIAFLVPFFARGSLRTH